MNKLFVMVVILGFWLVLPVPFMLMEVTNYDSTTMTGIMDNLNNPINNIQHRTGLENFINGIGNLISTIWNLGVLYFQVLIIGIPNVPSLINYFLLLLKIVSAVTLFFMFRGD